MAEQQMGLSIAPGHISMAPGQISVSYFDKSVLEINKQNEEDEIRELETKINQLQEQKIQLEKVREQELQNLQKQSIQTLKANFERNSRDIEIYQQKISRYMDATKKEVGQIVIQGGVLTPLSIGIALGTAAMVVLQIFAGL